MSGGSRIEIGGIARAHGIRGEVSVALHNPDSTALEGAAEIYVGQICYAVEAARPVPQGWLVKLAGVDDRTTAEGLRGAVVEVDRQLVAGDEPLLADLVGLRVQLADGSPWGEVVAIEVGAQDRLVIHDGAEERLLPVVAALIVSIDAAAGVITVAPPEGMPSTPLSSKKR